MSLDIARFRDTLVKLHVGALVGPLVLLLSYILSPEFLNALPEKYSKIGYGLATLISIFAPSLLKKTIVPPRTE